MSAPDIGIDLSRYALGWADEEAYVFKPKRGLTTDIVQEMSWMKGEPDWMRDFRLKSLRHFERRPMPSWGGDMSGIDFDNIYYYIKPTDRQVDEWEELPEAIKATYEKLGIPQAERKYLAGVTAQYECLRGSTRVWTTGGMRPIKDLQPGDVVFSLDEATGHLVRADVVRAVASGDKEIFEVRADGRVIGASGNHPFLALRDDEHVWVPVEGLRVGDRVAVATRVSALVGPAGATGAEIVLDGAVIDSLDPTGVETTFDIEVAGHHNFVAEGFVVHNSEVVFHRNREDLAGLGVIFSDMDTALREYPELVKPYFGTIIPQNDNKFAALNSAVWSGGCLTADARINVKGKGLVSIADIAAGDEVFGIDVGRNLRRGKVLAKIDSGTKPVFRIRVKGRTLEATGNHHFLVARRVDGRWRGVWMPLDEIAVGEPIAIPRSLLDDGEPFELPAPQSYLKNHHHETLTFPTHTTDELMWLFGVYIGDGHVGAPAEHMRQTSFALPDDDAVRAPALAALDSLFGVTHVTPVKCGFVVSSKQLGNWIHDVGFDGLAHTKRLPAWVFSTPQSQQLSLLAGLVDADGWTERDGKSLCIELCNRELLEDVRQLAIGCGLFADGQLTERTRTVVFADGREITSTGWRLRIQGDLGRVPMRDPRKRGADATAWRRTAYTAATGQNFTSLVTDTVGFAVLAEKVPLEHKPTYDIQVVGLENFVANGIVAHNSFIYVPPGVEVPMPLQAYFRINAENMGQFERTLIIADEGAKVHYIEGCSAPVYTTDSLHSAVVEIVVKPSARVTYTTIQNWSNNVYNLVTKRARVEAEGHMEWIDGNIGCLAEGSTVTTPGGPKPIELVTPGDQVLSYDEAGGELVFRTVLAKRFSGDQAVRTVRSGVRELRVTDNHPFLSYTYDPTRPKKLGRYELGYVRADQLTSAIVPTASLDYGEPHKLELPDETTVFDGANQYATGFRSERRRAGRLAAPERTDNDLMWLFGLFVGDGSIERKPAANGGSRWARVTFSVPRADRARDRLLEVMGRLMPTTEPGERADGVTIRWSSVELADLFEDNGFVSGAHRKRVPAWVRDIPESQRLAFVAGCLDSDGCAPQGKRGCSIKSVNRALLEDIGVIMTSLGIPARLHTEHSEPRTVTILGYESTARGSHRLEFPADPRLVAHVTPSLQAAVEAQRPPATRSFRRVGRSSIVLPETVELRPIDVSDPGPVVPTWDIEVEGTGNFVSEGFIVHNSRLTMKYPAVYMVGPKASGEVLSVAYAGPGQHQDAGAKMVHAAPETTSKIVSKSISKDGGRTSYRGLVRVEDDAHGCRSHVQCDALILDEDSVSDTFPYMEVGSRDAVVGHEATVSKVADEQLFYLTSRGLSEEQAMGMIVNGFIEPVTRTLPMEYAVEWSRLIELQMEGSVG